MAVVGLFLIAVSPLPPSSALQEAVQTQKPLEHQVAVTLKLIQVYVTDKKGNPVPDLKKEDFIVYDNGRLMTLTEFEKHIIERSAQKSEPQPAEEKILPTPLPPAARVTVMNRKFFLFFDFAFNNQKGIKKAKEAALHFLEKEVLPADEVGLISYSLTRGLSINEFLTTNHKKVRDAVEALDIKNIAGRADDIEQQYWRLMTEEGGDPALTIDIPLRRQDSKSQAQNFVLRVTALAKGLRYIPGQKHILLFSTGIPSTLFGGGQAGNPQGDAPSSQGTRGKLIPKGFEMPDHVLRTQYEDMHKELSSANCSIFAFDSREAAMVPTLFDFDEQTFGSRTSRDIFTGAGVHQNNPMIFKDEKITGLYSLTKLSKDTGGKYFGNINEFERNLDQLQIITGTYYVLGYYIGEQWDGRYHKIKVEVKRKGVEIHAQSGYFNPKPFAEYSNLEKQLHLFDLALNERPLLQTPLTFSMNALSYAAGEDTRLQMLSKIPNQVIDKFAGKKVELVALVFDENENLSSLQRTEADFTKYRGMDVFYTSGAALEPGSYKCRLVIRDLDTGAGAVASARVNVAKKAFIGLGLHSPLLLVQESNFVYLEAEAKNKNAGAWKDAYSYDRAQYSPLIGEVPNGIFKIFAILPYSMPGLVQPNIALATWLINSTSGERIPVPFSVLNKTGKEELETQFLELSLNNIPEGKYLLYFNAEDAGTKAVSYAQTTLIIK